MKNSLIQNLPPVATVLWGLLLCVLLARYFVVPFRGDFLPRLAGDAPETKRTRARAPVPLSKALLYVTAAFFVSRALLFLVLVVSCRAGGDPASFFFDPLSALTHWDGNHYISLAENFYVNEGDARFHLVFFPLYPMILRCFFLMGFDVRLAGVLVSNACLFGSAFLLYRLVERASDEKGGERATRFLLFCPLTIFFSIPYSESLFLFLTLLSVYLARRGKFGLAVTSGALCAATRLLGALVAVPIFYEALLRVRDKKGGLRDALVSALKTTPVALGTAFYLYLNWRVSGNPLQFLTYQSEHWSQRFGSFSNTLRYTLSNAFSYEDFSLRLGTWIPQALYILLVLVFLLLAYRKISAGDGAYAILYLYFAVAPTWLLSGSRYLTGLYALYPMLASLTKRRFADYALMSLSCLGLVYFTYFYAIVGSVM